MKKEAPKPKVPKAELKETSEVKNLDLKTSVELPDLPQEKEKEDRSPTPFVLAGQKLPTVQKDTKKELPPVESSSEEDESD